MGKSFRGLLYFSSNHFSDVMNFCFFWSFICLDLVVKGFDNHHSHSKRSFLKLILLTMIKFFILNKIFSLFCVFFDSLEESLFFLWTLPLYHVDGLNYQFFGYCVADHNIGWCDECWALSWKSVESHICLSPSFHDFCMAFYDFTSPFSFV